MFLNPIKKILIESITIIIIVLPSSLALGANSKCTNALKSISAGDISEDPFTNFDKAEQGIGSLIAEISSKYSVDQAQNARLEEILQRSSEEIVVLQQLQERIVEGESIPSSEFKSFYTRLTEIREEMVKATEFFGAMDDSAAGPQELSLNDIILDPKKVEAEKPYSIELTSGENLSVIISEKIVKDVFLDPSKAKVISRSLRKIQKGIFGSGYLGDGIIRMIADRNVVELRASGKDGNFRFFGYLEDNSLHIVLATMSSNHNGMTSTLSNVNKVISIRENRK